MRLRLLAAAIAGLACAVAANAATLRRQRVRLDGTVDSSPIYLHAARAGGRVRDLVRRRDGLRQDGRVILPEGDSNAHAETGVLDIYRPPGKR